MKFMFGLQHPLTCKPWITLSNPFNKVRGEYFSKEGFLRLYHASFIHASVFIMVSLWCCRWLYNTKLFIYLRYVDDTFFPFKSRSDALVFFDILNQLHSSLSFTIEEENNGQLPFLDVIVERCDSSFLTSVYRKPTFTGLYLDWHSFVPKFRKLNLIRCLSYRALNICSDCNIENELKAVKDIFIDNEYPEDVIDVNIRHTMTKFKNTNKVFGPPKYPIYFRLPWVGSASLSIADKIASSVYRCYHAVNLRPIFTTRPAFNSTNKDKLPIFKQSNLIYKFCLSI